MLTNASAYDDGIRKGIDWIVDQVNEDGSVNPTEKGSFAYYKLPWALAIAGRSGEAAAVTRRIASDTMTPVGDFYPDQRS